METSFEELLFNCVVWKLLGFGRRDGFAGAVLNTGFSMRRKKGDIFFLQKNLQVNADFDFRSV